MRNFTNLIERFSQVELNGFEAQRKYAPVGRITPTWEEIKHKNPKKAAVNILLYSKNGKWFFPLILRTFNQNDHHSGQISLPGGQYEKQDINLASTAIRETFEEIGIPKNKIKIIRELSPIYIPTSNYYVHSFVSWTSISPDFKLQKSEVQELIQLPLSTILNLPKEPEMKSLPSTKNQKVPIIDFNGYIIWGATFMILSEFRDLMKKV